MKQATMNLLEQSLTWGIQWKVDITWLGSNKMKNNGQNTMITLYISNPVKRWLNLEEDNQICKLHMYSYSEKYIQNLCDHKNSLKIVFTCYEMHKQYTIHYSSFLIKIFNFFILFTFQTYFCHNNDDAIFMITLNFV